MKEEDQENLYYWYKQHKNINLKDKNVNWLDILKSSNYLEERSACFLNDSAKTNDLPLHNESSNQQNSAFNYKTPENESNLWMKQRLLRNLLTPKSLNGTKEVAMSLGVNPNDADLSWTSSLQTPIASRTNYDENETNCSKDKLARVLFNQERVLNSSVPAVEEEKIVQPLAGSLDNHGNKEGNVNAPISQGFKLEEDTKKGEFKNDYDGRNMSKLDDESRFFKDILTRRNSLTTCTSTPVLRDDGRRLFSLKRKKLDLRKSKVNPVDCVQNTNYENTDPSNNLPTANFASNFVMSKEDVLNGVTENIKRYSPSNVNGNFSKFASKLSLKRNKCRKFLYPDSAVQTTRNMGIEIDTLTQTLNEPICNENSKLFLGKLDNSNIFPLKSVQSNQFPSKTDEINLQSSKTNDLDTFNPETNQLDLYVTDRPKLIQKQKSFVAACSLSSIESNKSKINLFSIKNETVHHVDGIKKNCQSNQNEMKYDSLSESWLDGISDLQTVPDIDPQNIHEDVNCNTTSKDMILSSITNPTNNFKNILKHDNTVYNSSDNIYCFVSKEMKGASGFQSTSGKNISVSDSSPAEVKHLWDKVNQEYSTIHDNTNNITTINIDVDDNNTLTHQKKNGNSLFTSVSKPSKFQGFQSASGKRIKVTESSLSKVKDLWNEINDASDINDILQKDYHSTDQIDKNSDAAVKMKFENFASSFSEKVINSTHSECRTQLEELEKSPVVNLESVKFNIEILKPRKVDKLKNYESPLDVLFGKLNDADKRHSSANYLGFQSASGKKVDVSEKALSKVKSLWDETEEILPHFTSKTSKPMLNVLVPDSSLDFAFQEANVSVTGRNINISSASKKEFDGFKSASGKRVSINDEALEKARALLSACDTNEDFTIQPHFDIGVNKKEAPPISSPQQIKIVLSESKAQGPNKGIIMIENKIKVESPESSDKSLSPIIGSQKVKRTSHKRVLPNEQNVSSNKITKLLKEDMEISSALTNTEFRSTSAILQSGTVANVSVGRKAQFNHYCNYSLEQNATLSTKFLNEFKGTVQPQSKANNNKSTVANAHLSLKSDTGGRNRDDSLGVHETTEINEITEAFLLDTSWDGSFGQEPVNQDCPLKKGGKITWDIKVLEKEREVPRKNQKEILEKKMKCKNMLRNYSEGYLYKLKQGSKVKRVKLSSLSISEPFIRDGIDVSLVTSETAMDYRFFAESNKQTTLIFEGDVEIIPGNDNKIGWQEIEMGFLISSEVVASLVPENWVSNHLRWIVWKLAALQKKLGNDFVQNPFTLKEVLLQLRFRYDWEIIGAKRSILRKIYEQDDIPNKTIILCVAEIETVKCEKKIHMVLTDGWYSIVAQVDTAMKNLILRKVIKVGMKLIIHGAELVGMPSPCHPLQGHDKYQIMLHTNMVRRSRWSTKLGLAANFGLPPSTVISSIHEDGGIIGTLDLFVCRRYPLVYMQKIGSKTSILNERAGEARHRQMDVDRENLAQKIYFEVEKELDAEEKTERISFSIKEINKVKKLTSGEEISLFMESCNDPSLIQALSQDQIELASRWTQDEIDRKRQKIGREVNARIKNHKQETVPMLKLGVTDKKGDLATITIWRPREEILSAATEGQAYRFHYLKPSGVRDNIKQLTWFKQTSWNLVKKTFDFNYCRLLTPLASLIDIDQVCEACWGEIDVVGVIAKVQPPKEGAQIAFISDSSCRVVVGLKFLPTIQEHRYSEQMTVGRVIGVLNARWKRSIEGGVPVLHVTSHTVISCSPKQLHLVSAVQSLKEQMENVPDFAKMLESWSWPPEATPHSRSPLSPHFKTLPKSATPREKAGAMGTLFGGIPVPVRPLSLKSSANKPFHSPVRSHNHKEV